MFGLTIPLRLYAYAAIALAIIGSLFYVRHLRHSNAELLARANTAEATLNAERLNTEKANAAAERYAISLENLKAARADTPVRRVHLCPAMPEAKPATGTDAAVSGGVSETAGLDFGDRWSDDGPDVGPELYAEADRADQCQVTLRALQEWVRAR